MNRIIPRLVFSVLISIILGFFHDVFSKLTLKNVDLQVHLSSLF